VVDEHPRRGAGCARERFEPVGEPVLERVVGARRQQSLLDLGLRASPHEREFFA
jgi:hypothetical protein